MGKPGRRAKLAMIVMILLSATSLFGQNPDEPLEDVRINLPFSFSLGVQEFTTEYTALSGSITYAANPIVVRNAFDENNEIRRSILVEHLTFNILGLSAFDSNTSAQIYSVHYAGTRTATHLQGPSGISRASLGPGLYLSESVAELAITGSLGYGYGYDWPNFSVGFLLEFNAGLVFFDGGSTFYSGGGAGIYMTLRQDLLAGRVQDLPAPEDDDDGES